MSAQLMGSGEEEGELHQSINLTSALVDTTNRIEHERGGIKIIK